jgi:hypothetical protein
LVGNLLPTVNSGIPSNYGLAVTVFVRFKFSLSTSRLMISIISYCSLRALGKHHRFLFRLMQVASL